MKETGFKWLWPAILLLALPLAQVGANEIYNKLPFFTAPDGPIAYLGSYYDPQKIWDTASNHTTLRSWSLQIPPASQAVSEVQASLLENAAQWGLRVAAIPASGHDLKALLLHMFHPGNPDSYPFGATKLYNLAGGSAYVLVGLIDYYGTFGCPVNVRVEDRKGLKINYFRRRSILEKDESFFKWQGYNKVGAFELFLLSTRDGSLLWQANGCYSTQHITFEPFRVTADHEMYLFMKTLVGKK